MMEIRTKLYGIAIITMVGLLVVLFANLIGSGYTHTVAKVRSLALESEVQMLECRRGEKNFLTRKDVKYIKVVREGIGATEHLLTEIARLDPSFTVQAGEASKLMRQYGAVFISVADGVKAMGLTENEGISGSLRTAIHEIEAVIDEQKDDTLIVAMLMLRRHEKDFMLRGSINYLKKFQDAVKVIRGLIENSPRYEAAIKDLMFKLLDVYQARFEDYVRQYESVEHDMKRFTDLIRLVEPSIAEIAKQAEVKREKYDQRVLFVVECVEAVAAVIIFAAIFLVIRSIMRPLARLQGYARAVAEGSNETWDSQGFTGELKALGTDISVMVAHLRESMDRAEEKGREAALHAEKASAALDEATAKEAHIAGLMQTMTSVAEDAKGIAQRLALATEQLAVKANKIKAGAETQTQRLAETATAMEEMNATVIDVARNAASTAESADQGRKLAQSGKSEVGGTIEEIADIQVSNNEISEVMDELSTKAKSIGNVIDMISDIADQTNLLALNAAIEAARAGDAGRGFAVVADEVRKLAEKTMSATSEVGQAIRGIQESVHHTVSKRQVADGALEKTLSRARQAGDLLGEIVTTVEQSADLSQGIATAAEEQSATSEEINRTVAEINCISQETAEGIAESAQAIQEVASLADELRALIGKLGSTQKLSAENALPPFTGALRQG